MTLATGSNTVGGGGGGALDVNLSFLFTPVQAQQKETCLRYQKMKPSNIATQHITLIWFLKTGTAAFTDKKAGRCCMFLHRSL